MKYKNRAGQIVVLEDKELFTAGGQGRIHKVKGEMLVGKLYISSDKSKLDKLDQKLCFMVDNPPFDNSTPQEVISSIVWPVDTLYDYSKNFVGFIMPLVQDSISLEELVVLNKKVDKKNHIVYKFSKLNNRNFLYQRLVMCYNLASVLKVIHQRNQYVVVDLKPQNILINFDGKIALIDIDSIQVQTYSKLYHADAHTPEYSPPEFHNKKINYAKSKVDANWDYFAFATTAYQILFQLPPFVGTVDGHTEQIENIAKQYFPHGRHKRKYKFIPPPHKEFKALSSDLKQAFIDTFDKDSNERVDFRRWIDSFLLQLKKTPKSKVVNNPFVRKKTKYTSSNNPTGTPRKSLKKSINFLKIFSWVAIGISTFIIKLKSILNILMLVIIGLVIMFYIVGYIQEINKIEVYEDIFNLKNHYTISEDKIKKLLDTQTINGIVWEQYIIETEDGSKIVWIREDDL